MLDMDIIAQRVHPSGLPGILAVVNLAVPVTRAVGLGIEILFNK